MLKSARFPEFKDPEVRKEAIEKMKEVGDVWTEEQVNNNKRKN